MLILQILRYLTIWIDNIGIYLIDKLFQLFSMTAMVTLKPSVIQEYASKIYVFLAIIMLFKLAFSAITYIANPDTIDDKSKGAKQTFKNIFVVLILIFTTPMIFSFAMEAQYIILNKNILAKIIMGVDPSNSNTTSVETYYAEKGKEMAFSVYSGFINVNTDLLLALGASPEVQSSCSELYEVNDNGGAFDSADKATACFEYLMGKDFNYRSFTVEGIANRNPFYLADYDVLTAIKKVSSGEKYFVMDYLPVITSACLLFIAYIMLIFCFDIAVRCIKMSFLQIIAPIPIISYIDPKSGQSGMFKKWVSTSFKTYIDIFIRLGIIFFAIELITRLLKMDNYIMYDTQQPVNNFFVKVLLVLGILKFAKDLPRLIQEITGIDLKGDFTFSLGKKIGEIPVAGRLAQKGMAGTAAAFSKDLKGAGIKERIKYGFNTAKVSKEIGWGGDKKSVFTNPEAKRRKEEKEKALNDDILARRTLATDSAKWDKGTESLEKFRKPATFEQYKAAGFRSKEFIDSAIDLNKAKQARADKAAELENLMDERYNPRTTDERRKELGGLISKANEDLKGLSKAEETRAKTHEMIGNKKENVNDMELEQARKIAKDAPRPVKNKTERPIGVRPSPTTEPTTEPTPEPELPEFETVRPEEPTPESTSEPTPGPTSEPTSDLPEFETVRPEMINEQTNISILNRMKSGFENQKESKKAKLKKASDELRKFNEQDVEYNNKLLEIGHLNSDIERLEYLIDIINRRIKELKGE